MTDEPRPPPLPLAEAVRVWARIAALSFGGPAGQIAVMHRILVEEKRWISEERFLHALNYCMLLPGPEAQQLATYIGWLMHRTKGGLIAGGLFVLPGFVSIMILSWLYAALGDVAAVEALFFGLKAAVLAIVLEAVRRIGSRALRNNVMRALAAAAFLAIFFLAIPFPLIVVGAALIGFAAARAGSTAFAGGGGHGPAGPGAIAPRETLLGDHVPDHARPNLGWSLRISAILLLLWLGPVAALLLLLGPDDVFSRIAIFFSQLAVVTFGGAYAVLAWVAQEAVEKFGWLEPGEMLDGLGMAETTPGPLIMVTQFVGFMGAFRQATGLPPMVAGTLGGILTTWVTFVPCFLWIFLGAPFVERLRGDKVLSAALAAITAAVVGVVLNLALWFAFHTLFREQRHVAAGPLDFDLPVLASANVPALILAAGAIFAMFRLKLGPLPVLAGCAALGAGYWLVAGANPA
ncbi:MAG TPA: chromate efflux transporter [Allosphingosinicella sp.]|nr:chromate efflux transporter [Allosphingosinicella sp.]